MLSKRYQLLLLSATVLAAYVPALFADFSPFDDRGLYNFLANLNGWDLQYIFKPRTAGGLYYRPFLSLSYLFDKNVLNLSPFFMHFENILLHIVNTLLVYFLALRITPADLKSKSLIPLVAAFLFGLHPVNAESVNWISGRTDVLAGTYVLASALLLLTYRDTLSAQYIIFALLCILGGALTKETALAFLPGGFFIVTAVETGIRRDNRATTPADQRASYTNILLLLGVLAVIIVVALMRSTAFTYSRSHIGMTVKFIMNDMMYSMLVMLRAVGFYMKKLVCPLPFNFAIQEIDPLYEILGIPCVMLFLYLVLRRDVRSAFFVAGCLLIVPAFVIAFGQIAWTRYAERYVYIPAAFLSISATSYFGREMKGRWLTFSRVSITAWIAIAFILVLGRSLVWIDPLSLLKDTVEKSPSVREIRASYAALLSEKGDHGEALKQLEKGRSLPFLGYDERFDLITAQVYRKVNRIDDAIKLAENAVQKTGGRSREALELLISLLDEQKEASGNTVERTAVTRALLAYNLQLYRLTRGPHVLYALGNLSDELGDRKRAIIYYHLRLTHPFDNDQDEIDIKKRIAALSR